jgi:hypothetical protein
MLATLYIIARSVIRRISTGRSESHLRKRSFRSHPLRSLGPYSADKIKMHLIAIFKHFSLYLVGQEYYFSGLRTGL